MARRGRRRREPEYVEDDAYDEQDGYEDDYEDDYDEAPRRTGANPVIWLFPAAAALLLIVALGFKYSGGGGGGRSVNIEENERRVLNSMLMYARDQEMYWRVMFSPKEKIRRFAEHFPDLYYKHKKFQGAPLWVRECARAKSAEKAYRGYYYVDIKKDAAGEAYDYRKGYAIAAIPADYGRTGNSTFIVNNEKGVYSKDTGGKAPDKWPTEMEMAGENGWLRE